MKNNFYSLVQASLLLNQQNICKDKILHLSEFWTFKMDVIKWYSNFVSCNFGLNSHIWFQTKLHSTTFNYHYWLRNVQTIRAPFTKIQNIAVHSATRGIKVVIKKASPHKLLEIFRRWLYIEITIVILFLDYSWKSEDVKWNIYNQ